MFGFNDLQGRLMQVLAGAGSGCFSIAFAQANTDLACSLMDLAPTCEVALESVKAAGLQWRIRAVTRDMFREA